MPVGIRICFLILQVSFRSYSFPSQLHHKVSINSNSTSRSRLCSSLSCRSILSIRARLFSLSSCRCFLSVSFTAICRKFTCGITSKLYQESLFKRDQLRSKTLCGVNNVLHCSAVMYNRSCHVRDTSTRISLTIYQELLPGGSRQCSVQSYCSLQVIITVRKFCHKT